jgi:hypothetical protein
VDPAQPPALRAPRAPRPRALRAPQSLTRPSGGSR